METTLNFGPIDLEAFLLEGRVGFLHMFKNKATLIKSDITQKNFPHVRYNFACKVNNYRLVLTASQYTMPDKLSEQHINSLIGYMEILWNGRRTLNRDELILLSDNLISSYESLVNDFQQRKLHHSST